MPHSTIEPVNALLSAVVPHDADVTQVCGRNQLLTDDDDDGHHRVVTTITVVWTPPTKSARKIS